MATNRNKHVWEGWTVGDFIDELTPILAMIMSGRSWMHPLTTKAELAKWCKDNQPYYKRNIPEVTNHFAKLYNLK